MAILGSFPFEMDRREEIVPNTLVVTISISISRVSICKPLIMPIRNSSTEQMSRRRFEMFRRNLEKIRMMKTLKEQEISELKKKEKNIFYIKKMEETYGNILRSCNIMQKIYEEILRSRNFAREKLLMTSVTMIMLISQFLAMFISSRCKKRYVLLWTDKAVLLVLWTCGDVELNPGPNGTNPAKARSQILREFRRSAQTILLELMYKSSNRTIPINPYSDPPPGWDEYKPEIKFGNISNLRSGEDKVFSKMIWLLQNWSSVPLSSEWEVLLTHYNNLNAKLEQEESKIALEKWMLEKKLIPLLQEYSEDVNVPLEEIQDLCLAILLKAPNKDQLDVLDSKKFDDQDLKTNPNGYAGFRQTNEGTADAELHPLEVFNNKERPESDTDISAGARSLNQHCVANQSIEVPHRVQRKRRCTEESTSAAGTTCKIVKGGEKDLVQSQELLMENIPLIIEKRDGDPQNTADDQCMQTCLENVDPTMLPCNNCFVESDRDCAQQISSSKDNFRELKDQETLRSKNLPGEENHTNDTCYKLLYADYTCGELLQNLDMSLCFNNIDICDDELNELDGDQAEMSHVMLLTLEYMLNLPFNFMSLTSLWCTWRSIQKTLEMVDHRLELLSCAKTY